MAGEASGNLQIMVEGEGATIMSMSYHGGVGERVKGGVLHTFKQPDLLRTLSQEQHQRKKSAPMIQSPPTKCLPQHWGLQFNMRFGWRQSQTI